MAELAPAPSKGPIFIMGAMGTGTTLLRLVLDSHDAIAVPQETGFMRGYKAHMYIPFKASGRNWARRLGWTREELDAELAAFYNRLFMRYVERHGKQRWGEKTPLHVWHWDAMLRLFPDAVFVAIVRHPGGSIASNYNRWARLSLRQSVAHFERYTHEILRQAAKHADRTVILRYEDLLLSPEPLMRELVAWLGEPWSDSVLEHHRVQADRGGRDVVEGRTRVTDPIDLSRMTKWTQTITVEQRERLDARIGRLAEFTGYSMGDAAVLDPLTADGGLLLGGHEVAERMAAFADLALEVRPEVPRYERYYDPRKYVLEDLVKPPPPAPAPRNRFRWLPAPLRVALDRTRRRVRSVLR